MSTSALQRPRCPHSSRLVARAVAPARAVGSEAALLCCRNAESICGDRVPILRARRCAPPSSRFLVRLPSPEFPRASDRWRRPCVGSALRLFRRSVAACSRRALQLVRCEDRRSAWLSAPRAASDRCRRPDHRWRSVFRLDWIRLGERFRAGHRRSEEWRQASRRQRDSGRDRRMSCLVARGAEMHAPCRWERACRGFPRHFAARALKAHAPARQIGGPDGGRQR
jgi:hypothetical protein